MTPCYNALESQKGRVSLSQWDKLIAGLTKINWHAEPTTLISEDSK